MKKILCFLIGFTLPFIFYQWAYATECDSSSTSTVDIDFYVSIYGGIPHVIVGYYSTKEEAAAANVAATGGAGAYYGSVTDGIYCSTKAGSVYFAIVVAPANCVAINIDADNDGLSDDCDFYPDDPSSYSVLLVTYQTTDNTSDGAHAREVYLTDRGDYFSLGADYDGSLSDHYVKNISSWKDPSDICGTLPPSGSGPQDDETGLQNPGVTNNPPDGDAAPDTDPTLKPGKQSDGTETGDGALRDILDNTGNTASNTKRIGEYMRSLNAAIQNMNRNAIVANQRAEQEAAEKAEQEAEAQKAHTDFQNFDVEDAIGDQLDPTITEGEEGDYVNHGPLAEETWVIELIESNPVAIFFSESGFEFQNSSCTASLDLGYLGQHSINLCPLEHGFIAFGNLLVAFTTLLGMIHLITGRGF